jgi:polysaccharide biosynthesis/export protein
MNTTLSFKYTVLRAGLSVLALALVSACSTLPSIGPTAKMVTAQALNTNGIRIVDVDTQVARDLSAACAPKPFSELFKAAADNGSEIVGAGDVLEVSVWEAPPAVLFSSGVLNSLTGGASTIAPSGTTTFPTQMVSGDGFIYVPFAGKVPVIGKRLQAIEAEVVTRLSGKANQPQVLVRLVANNTSYVTVVGEVTSSTRMALTPRGEHLLDALASAGGTRQPTDKVELQLTRGAVVHALPLDAVIRDPKQNIALEPGDVVTALFQPLSFTALGGMSKSDEVPFEAKGISLAQALARVGGLNGQATAEGVFIFRFETKQVTSSSGVVTQEKTPIIYRVNLKDPRTFFVAQNFPMQNQDVMYVANAPSVQLQQFLNLIFSTVYPIENTVNLAHGGVF